MNTEVQTRTQLTWRPGQTSDTQGGGISRWRLVQKTLGMIVLESTKDF